MKREIIFVHGFGVRKDSKGLFTYLASELSKLGYVAHLIDLYTYTPGEVSVLPIDQQVELIKKYISINEIQQPSFIAHSMGCAVLCSDKDLVASASQIILLAPAIGGNPRRWRQRLIEDKNALVDEAGNLTFIKRNGEKMSIPEKFFSEPKDRDWLELYQTAAVAKKVSIIVAEEDEVITFRKEKLFTLGARCVVIDEANHNFTDHKEELRDVLTQFFLTDGFDI